MWRILVISFALFASGEAQLGAIASLGRSALSDTSPPSADEIMRNYECYNYVPNGEIPRYVYDYSKSRNRYNKLLTGLALFNLDRMMPQRVNTEFGVETTDIPVESVRKTCYMTLIEISEGEELDVNAMIKELKENGRSIDCKLMKSFVYQAGATTSDGKVVVSSVVGDNPANNKYTPPVLPNALDDRRGYVSFEKKTLWAIKDFFNGSHVTVMAATPILLKYAECLPKDHSSDTLNLVFMIIGGIVVIILFILLRWYCVMSRTTTT